MDALAAELLIVLHTVGGHEVAINPRQVTHLQASKPGQPNQHFVQGVRCMVNFTDGKFITVVETCDQVRKLLEDAKR